MVLKNLFSGQQWRNRHRELTYGYREGEKRGRCMERVTWKLTLPYVKYIANENFLCGSGNSNRALYQGVGWGGRWEGDSKGSDICVPMADSC